MTQNAVSVTLGELLETTEEEERDSTILERIKLLAQEYLPEGWTNWTVTRRTKEEIFGTCIDPQILNKLRFALPTDELARAFDPQATHLSEKGFRDLKVKMLDWAFARALITSPPAICNRIRGSAAATEVFNQAVKQKRPMSRSEAHRALSLDRESEEESLKRRRDSSCYGDKPKRPRIELLEQRLETIFSTMMDRMDSLESRGQNPKQYERSSDEEVFSDNDNGPLYLSQSRSITPTDNWRAPSISNLETCQVTPPTAELDFLPNVREMEPDIPAPTEQIKAEGIACQRFGSEAWSRIRYKDVAKRLQATPVFSTLKVNTELAGLGAQTSGFLAKYEGVLGTITHGLLCQRKKLAEDLKDLAKKFPEASESLRKLLSEGSGFKSTSDDILQFVCAHRAETIDMRRKAFRAKNEVLSAVLHQIPPSSTHIFDEQKLTSFLKDQGGVSRIFPSRFGSTANKQTPPFRQYAKGRNSTTPVSATALAPTRPKQPTWRTRPAQPSGQRRGQPGSLGKKRPEKPEQRQQRRRY